MSGVALVTFNRAVSLLGSSAATAIIALLPAVASILAAPILGETASPAEWASIAVIVLGVLFAAKPACPHSSPTVPQPEGDARDPLLLSPYAQSRKGRPVA